MADFTRRTVTTRRVEYVLPSPANWTEVGKAFAAARQELGDRAQFDDVVQVKAWDDELVISFELSTEVTR